MTYQISNPRKFREQVGASLQQAETRLRSRLDAALRQTYGRRGFEAALSEERSAMMLEVRDQMRPEAENLGVQVVDVRVRRTDLTAEVLTRPSSAGVLNDWRKRNVSVPAGRKQRAGSRPLPIVRLLKSKRKRSVKPRSFGVKAKGNATGYSLKPISAIPSSLPFTARCWPIKRRLNNSDTTLVLSPNSEFFKFFQDAGGTIPAKPAN